MTRKTSFTAQTAMTITRIFGTMGLTLGLLLGVLGILQPATAQPIAIGDAALPAAVGDNLEPATAEAFTKVGFRSHRGFRRRHFKGGHGFRTRRFFPGKIRTFHPARSKSGATDKLLEPAGRARPSAPAQRTADKSTDFKILAYPRGNSLLWR